jgi:hypothetical protein
MGRTNEDVTNIHTSTHTYGTYIHTHTQTHTNTHTRTYIGAWAHADLTVALCGAHLQHLTQEPQEVILLGQVHAQGLRCMVGSAAGAADRPADGRGA